MSESTGSDPLVFGGPGWKRVFGFVFFTLMILALIAVFVIVSQLEESMRPMLYVVAGVVAFLALLLLFGREHIASYLQPRVEIGDAVHLCGGGLRQSIPLDAVDLIRVTNEDLLSQDSSRVHLVLRAGRIRRFLILDGDEAACAEALHVRCPNAIYVDLSGKEHLPTDSTRPFDVLNNLARERARQGRRAILIGILTLLGTVAGSWVASRGEDGFFVAIWSHLWTSAGLGAGSSLVVSGVLRLRASRKLAARLRGLRPTAGSAAP
jgi:hypothetical protein